MKFLNKSQQFNKIIGSPAKRAMRAGKKEGGLEEGIFARPLLLGGGWVCVAEGDAQVNQNFAQKRFALRPVIATNLNIANFADGGGTERRREREIVLAPALPCAGDNKGLP